MDSKIEMAAKAMSAAKGSSDHQTKDLVILVWIGAVFACGGRIMLMLILSPLLRPVLISLILSLVNKSELSFLIRL